MKQPPPETVPSTYLGHVQNGIIVLDTPLALADGLPVRVEPLNQTPISSEAKANQLEQMKTLFAQWDAEDGQLNDADADCLQHALQEHRGLTMRTPPLADS